MPKFTMFEPCAAGDCDDCVGEFYTDANDGRLSGAWTRCGCDCHAEGPGFDVAYEAGYAYASGYHD